ncbi:MAG: ABC transporter substrate-binding protein [Eubacterium sp.]|nr:ABC transporter substrate-binding protein [Eubacterium sp.]
MEKQQQSNGIDIEVIATTSSDMAYSLVVNNNLDISSIADLKGKKIVAGFGTVPYKFLSDLLEKNGLTIIN